MRHEIVPRIVPTRTPPAQATAASRPASATKTARPGPRKQGERPGPSEQRILEVQSIGSLPERDVTVFATVTPEELLTPASHASEPFAVELGRRRWRSARVVRR